MNEPIKFFTLSLACVILIFSTIACTTNSTEQGPETNLTGFEERVDAMFRAESGKPLVRAEKQPPLGPGRGNYVRAYSYSMMRFAARCLYLGEMRDSANAALAENAQHYLDHPLDINDRDSFHWHAEVVLRLIELYGPEGSRQAGLITKETESLILEPIWIYVKQFSTLEKADYTQSQTWHIYGSENHHSMSFTLCWHFSKIAKDRPEYKDLKYEDGASAVEHYQAWNVYFITYSRERSHKGMCVEMMCTGYNTVMTKGFYNFYDFGEPEVRRAAGLLLDLYWTYWAQEQIDGISGGGKSRIRGLKGFSDSPPVPAWIYFGIGPLPKVQNVGPALSDYRPPAVVEGIAVDVTGRGRYEVYQRAQGLGTRTKTLEGQNLTKLRTDGGGILRYTFCDPAFIIGTPMTEARPLDDWVPISSQSRWQGVIFAGDEDARIVPAVRSIGNDTYNAFWSVQSKGSLITQKLQESNRTAGMMVWISNAGLSEPVEEDGIVFTEAEGAYAAVRVIHSGFERTDQVLTNTKQNGNIDKTPPGTSIILKDEYAPVILEVMAKSDIESFEAFKEKVKSSEMNMDGPVLQYKTIYGDQLTLDTSYAETPTINGEPVNYAPEKVFDSPFLNADWNSGIVTISKGEQKKVLDFTK
jgi:hypothetical protein